MVTWEEYTCRSITRAPTELRKNVFDTNKITYYHHRHMGGFGILVTFDSKCRMRREYAPRKCVYPWTNTNEMYRKTWNLHILTVFFVTITRRLDWQKSRVIYPMAIVVHSWGCRLRVIFKDCWLWVECKIARNVVCMFVWHFIALRPTIFSLALSFIYGSELIWRVYDKGFLNSSSHHFRPNCVAVFPLILSKIISGFKFVSSLFCLRSPACRFSSFHIFPSRIRFVSSNLKKQTNLREKITTKKRQPCR